MSFQETIKVQTEQAEGPSCEDMQGRQTIRQVSEETTWGIDLSASSPQHRGPSQHMQMWRLLACGWLPQWPMLTNRPEFHSLLCLPPFSLSRFETHGFFIDFPSFILSTLLSLLLLGTPHLFPSALPSSLFPLPKEFLSLSSQSEMEPWKGEDTCVLYPQVQWEVSQSPEAHRYIGFSGVGSARYIINKPLPFGVTLAAHSAFLNLFFQPYF